METPFVTQDGTRITNGVIDLVFQVDGGWQIVDYKTDMNLDSHTYDAQLGSYRDALREIGCKVADAKVVPVRSQS